MPYATGTANSATDLLNALTGFCTANGWTLTTGALSKGSNHFRPGVVNGHLKVEMGTAAGFAEGAGVTGATLFPYIHLSGAFPVYYRLFQTTLNGADTVILCVQEANGIDYKYLMFGNLENKIGAWNGGQWMHASYSAQTYGAGGTTLQTEYGVNIAAELAEGGDSTESYSGGHGPLFAQCDGLPNFGSNWLSGNSFVRCDLDGGTYKRNETGQIGVNDLNGCVDAFRWMKWPLRYQPNTWNGESVLIPFHVFLGRATNTCSRLGTVGHIRALRMDNYEPADIITLGSDRWMVLPMYRRNPAAPFGEVSTSLVTGHSGQLAYAIKYDGP